MKNSKVLSVILLVASVLGIIGGGTSLNSVQSAKARWEEKAAASQESLGQLEEALTALQGIEEDYYAGREALAQGQEDYELGIQTLEEKKTAYGDGLKTIEEKQAEYDAGMGKLAEEQAALEEGAAELEARRAEYEAGLAAAHEYEARLEAYQARVKEYEAGEASLAESAEAVEAGQEALDTARDKLDAGEKTLAEAAGLISDAQAELDAGKAAYASGSLQLETLCTAAEGVLQAYYGDDSGRAGYQADFTAVKEADEAGLADMIDAKGNLTVSDAETKLIALTAAAGSGSGDTQDYETQIAQLRQLKDEAEELIAARPTLTAGIQELFSSVYQAMTEDGSVEQNVTDQVRALSEMMGGLDGLSDSAFKMALDQVLPVTNELLTVYTEQYAARLDAAAAALETAEESLKSAQTEYEAGAKQLLEGRNAYEAGIQVLREKQADYEDGAAQLADTEARLAAEKAALDADAGDYEEGVKKLAEAEETLETGEAELKAKQTEYDAAEAELAVDKEQLDEGYARLDAAKAELDKGETALREAEEQLAAGEAELKVFEEGRDQVIAGLEQVLATEGEGGLAGVAERLGTDYSYMKNDTDLDTEKGFEALAAAKELSGDTAAAAAKELGRKTAGSVISIAAGVLAALGGLFGLADKPKGIRPMGILAAVGAAAAFVLTQTAGSSFLTAAGGSDGFVKVTELLLTAAGVYGAVAAGKRKEAAAK
ncbi:MAG: hypothetical protein K6C08_11735 [Oscillospiraceae bacterium]|nr:hypothetical protein [Oscillospiraceae bacterium]